MKRIISRMILLISLILMISSCRSQTGTFIEEGKSDVSTDLIKEEGEQMNIKQTGYTIPIKDEYLKPALKQGEVYKLDYPSKDYAYDGGDITKTAYVYTPYGYDENDKDTRYDVLYLMHGWTGQAGEYFYYAKDLFDNMIENGDMKPMIIVSATFYNENSDTGFSSSVRELRAFHEDFEENLMPLVETQFNTYANSSSREDLMASRKHRAFGGFSLGSVTTWLEFCHDYDYIYYFLPMSGSSWYYGGYGDFQFERNVDHIEELVKENDLNERGYFIYHCVGTRDAVKDQSIDMAQEMLGRKDVFTAEHYVFYQKQNGQHDYDAVREYLYNALPLFFRQ